MLNRLSYQFDMTQSWALLCIHYLMVILIFLSFLLNFFIVDIKLGSEEGNNEVVDNSGEESDEDNSDRGRKRKWKPPKGEEGK